MPSSSSLVAALLQGGAKRALWSGRRRRRRRRCRHDDFFVSVGIISTTIRSNSIRNLHATNRTAAPPHPSGGRSSGRRRSAAAGSSSSSNSSGSDQQQAPQSWRRGGTTAAKTTSPRAHSPARHRNSHNRNKSSADPQQQQEFIWVPRAYRGWLPEGPPSSYSGNNYYNRSNHKNAAAAAAKPKSHYHNHNHHKQYDAASSSSSSFEERQRSRERKRAARAAREKAEECLHLHSQLLQLAAEYRRHFQAAVPTAATLDGVSGGAAGGAAPAPSNATAGSAFSTQYSASSSLPSFRRVENVQQLRKQVEDALRNIHESDGAVRSIDASEHDFRAVCSKLQALCTTACGATTTTTTTTTTAVFPTLSPISNTAVQQQPQQQQQHSAEKGYADLAECCVRQLVLLGRDRSLLADALKTYGRHQQHALDACDDTSTNEADGADESGVTGWFKKVVKGIFRPPRHLRNVESDDAGQPQDHRHPQGLYAHQDPSLQVPRRLFRTVLMSIAATVSSAPVPNQQNQQPQPQHQKSEPQNNNQDLGLETEPRGETGYVGLSETLPWELKDYQSSPYEAAAERMMDLLDDMPADWTPDTDSLRIIMDMLCRAATLNSARTCHHLYDRHSSLQYGLQFAMVLEAYLQATKKAATENDKKLQVLIADEASNVIRCQWDRNLPKHWVERIVHCSIVLNCLSIAVAGSDTKNKNDEDDNNKDDDEETSHLFCDKANTLAKAALGGPTWAKLLEEMEAEAPKVDTQILPVVNYLTQLYAPSGNKHLVETAKRMLQYMMHHGRDGVGRFMVFPDAETCNAVLRALLERNDSKKKETVVGNFEKNDDDSTTSTASSSVKNNCTLESDFEYAQRVVEYMHRRKEVECWPDKETYQILFGFLDAAQPDNVGALAEEWLSLMEAKKYLSRNSSLTMNANNESVVAESAISLSSYHQVFRYLLKEARSSNTAAENDVNKEATTTSRNSSSDSLPCTRALRLLDRLQVQSVPMVLNDQSVRAQLPDLYELDLRPTRHTLMLILQICAHTHQDRERAAAVALEVYQRWVDQDGSNPGKGMTSLLQKCASFLPESSETRQEIDACIQYLNELMIPNNDQLQTA